MFTFAVRPGYKTKDLLIEFRKGTGDDEMISALKQVLAKADVEVIDKTDLWQNDEMIYKMQSKYGEFELSSSNYGCIFITAQTNQAVIKSLAKLFSESGTFQEELVDPGQYT